MPGPPPKPRNSRARTNADPVAVRTLACEPAVQPPLPDLELSRDGKLIEWVWPRQTVDWWAMWGRSPLSVQFTEVDWSELMAAALLHGRYWRGDFSVAGELRLRVAKFGATPEDRLRLRIQWADADAKDAQRSPDRPSGASADRAKYGTLTALPPPKDRPGQTGTND
jgi:hypothetical protein